MKTILAVLGLLISTNVFAQGNGVYCASASGETRYQLDSFVGGMPPRIGAQIGDERIYLNNALISDQKRIYGVTQQVPLYSADFDQNTRHTLSDTGTVQIYSISMTVSPNGAQAGASLGPVTEWVICNYINAPIP